MFSGKTEKLIELLSETADLGGSVKAFKPKIDNRYATMEIASHSKLGFPAEPLSVHGPSPFQGVQADLVGIDEAQFFEPWLIEDVLGLVRRGINVIASGLDLTFSGHPFGIMPELLCLADEIHKLGATCAKCGRPANRSYRTADSTAAVLVGGAESYEPRCLDCFEKP